MPLAKPLGSHSFAKACELVWTGKIIDAGEALRIGYVSRVVPHEDLAAATRALASELAEAAPVAVQLDKQLIYGCLGLDLDKALEFTAWAQLIDHSTEDAKEANRALIEKRKPVYRGE